MSAMMKLSLYDGRRRATPRRKGHRDFIAKRLNSAELAEAQRMASEWKPK